MKTRKPRPGFLPLREAEAREPEPSAIPSSVSRYPPFFTEDDIRQHQREQRDKAYKEAAEQAEHDHVFTSLRLARRKAEELAGEVRGRVFNDWVNRCVVTANVPAEWTQARVLYESYLKHGKTYGRNRSQREHAVQELATETQWGRMMATSFRKKRRTAGWYYPLRCKRG